MVFGALLQIMPTAIFHACPPNVYTAVCQCQLHIYCMYTHRVGSCRQVHCLGKCSPHSQVNWQRSLSSFWLTVVQPVQAKCWLVPCMATTGMQWCQSKLTRADNKSGSMGRHLSSACWHKSKMVFPQEHVFSPLSIVVELAVHSGEPTAWSSSSVVRDMAHLYFVEMLKHNRVDGWSKFCCV